MASFPCAKCLLAGGLLAVLAGCPATGEEVRPPRDQIFYPTALAITPDESRMFVVNANANLLHDSGSVVVVDLDAIDTMAQEWLEGDGALPPGKNCRRDARLPSLLQCDEREAIPNPDAGVRIGNFATAVALQELASGDLRLFVPVRGDPSVTWIDYVNGELQCEGDGAVPFCDTTNRILNLYGDPEATAIIDEPFGVYVDSVNQYAMVTHLSSAAVSLIDAPADGQPPQLVDALVGLFLASSGQPQSAVGVAGRAPGAEEGLVYITSRSENRVQMLYVIDEGGRPATLAPSEDFFMTQVEPSDDGRGIVFNADGSRAYIVNRDPPMLHVLDTALGRDGVPRNEFLGAVELCRDPANVAVADMGRGERAYVSCFPEGQVWVVDPEARSVEAVIDAGRGPHALALAPGRKRLYVTNYLEDTIAVVDLTPGAGTENRMILRLGHPRQEEDE